ncbi:MAG: hypothetical protein KAU29_01150 [Gammaproteobacteria bacterium]|nr:hypothetical protein [Gammaproteobacteria bacterium]
MKFEHISSDGAARWGRLSFERGTVKTPAFMPVGTYGTVKATSLAGAMRDIISGKIPEGSKIVCTLAGHGLKDPDTAIQQSTAPMLTVDATMDAVKKAILDNMD